MNKLKEYLEKELKKECDKPFKGLDYSIVSNITPYTKENDYGDNYEVSYIFTINTVKDLEIGITPLTIKYNNYKDKIKLGSHITAVKCKIRDTITGGDFPIDPGSIDKILDGTITTSEEFWEDFQRREKVIENWLNKRSRNE